MNERGAEKRSIVSASAHTNRPTARALPRVPLANGVSSSGSSPQRPLPAHRRSCRVRLVDDQPGAVPLGQTRQALERRAVSSMLYTDSTTTHAPPCLRQRSLVRAEVEMWMMRTVPRQP